MHNSDFLLNVLDNWELTGYVREAALKAHFILEIYATTMAYDNRLP